MSRIMQKLRNIGNKLYSWYMKYSIPQENRYDSYVLSMIKLNVIFKMFFAFCIFEIILTFISDQMAQEMGGSIRVYYIIFGLFMAVGWWVTTWWKKQSSMDTDKAIITAKWICICTAICFGLLTFYEALTFDNPHNVIAVCVIIAIAVLFLVDINPILYTSIMFLLVTSNIKHLYSIYNNVSMIVNSYLLVIVTGFASYSFMKKELRRLRTEKELRNYTIAIENRVIDEINKRTKLQDDIIYAMADLVENRDIDTGAHIKRTAFYVKIIAESSRKLGYYTDEITDAFIEYLTKAMPLHDIGKIAIPDTILKAPRKLTEEEFEIMKTHTTKGAEIIKKIFANIEEDDYIKYAGWIANYHHEWWNGQGYPAKLHGTTIPLVARIATIADVFDALVSIRCYKSALAMEDALKIMEEEKGTHFDPYLFEAFLAAKKEILSVAETNSNSLGERASI